MIDRQVNTGLAERDPRPNGLPLEPPQTGRRVLVTGGAGYIGRVLVSRLLDRGYRVRVLDRRCWADSRPGCVDARLELVQADIRDAETIARALDGVDGVIALAGVANDTAAEHDPEANWQMNAVATEALGRQCVRRGLARVVFASSCSLYDRLPRGVHDEAAELRPQGPYATSKRYGEQALLAMVDHGLCPIVLRSGTVYGWSPRMRYDLVVNTFVRDALLDGRLALHGGGWMSRPLVDVRDASDAMIMALEAPAALVCGEIFNVLHSNHQVRELAMLVAGSAQLLGWRVRLEEAPAPERARDYECSSVKLASRLGFSPSRSVVEAIPDLLEKVDLRGAVRAHGEQSPHAAAVESGLGR